MAGFQDHDARQLAALTLWRDGTYPNTEWLFGPPGQLSQSFAVPPALANPPIARDPDLDARLIVLWRAWTQQKRVFIAYGITEQRLAALGALSAARFGSAALGFVRIAGSPCGRLTIGTRRVLQWRQRPRLTTKIVDIAAIVRVQVLPPRGHEGITVYQHAHYHHGWLYIAPPVPGGTSHFALVYDGRRIAFGRQRELETIASLYGIPVQETAEPVPPTIIPLPAGRRTLVLRPRRTE